MADQLDDRFEGMTAEATGTAKEARGTVTDNEETAADGQLEQAKGKAKQGIADAKLAGANVVLGVPSARAGDVPRATPAQGMPILRTPEVRFDGLVDYPFLPYYVEIDAGDGAGSRLQVHYLDERPREAAQASGHRCVAPDLVGFGKSDKPTNRFAYTYQSHMDWLRETVFDRLDLRNVTMVCHDWGGMLGLRLVASNTDLDTGDADLGPVRSPAVHRTIGRDYSSYAPGVSVHGPRWYRVEHHAGDHVRVLDRIPDAYAHPSTLTPFLSHLLLAGICQGDLVLIDEATGRTVACCAVRPQRRRVYRRQPPTMPARPTVRSEA